MKGHVSKRGKTWAYWFDIDPDPLTGKRRQTNGSGFKTEREAWKACRAAMADYEKGRVVRSSRRKVVDALNEWLDRIEHSIKPSMVQNWRNYAAQYRLVKPSGVSLSTFPQRHARDFVDDLMIRPPRFHSSWCSYILWPWAKPRLVW